MIVAGVRSGRGWPTPVLCDPSTHVACRNRPDICIPFERLQDGQADCPDASDEGQLFFFFFTPAPPQLASSSRQLTHSKLRPRVASSRAAAMSKSWIWLSFFFHQDEIIRTPAFCYVHDFSILFYFLNILLPFARLYSNTVCVSSFFLLVSPSSARRWRKTWEKCCFPNKKETQGNNRTQTFSSSSPLLLPQM